LLPWQRTASSFHARPVSCGTNFCCLAWTPVIGTHVRQSGQISDAQDGRKSYWWGRRVEMTSAGRALTLRERVRLLRGRAVRSGAEADM
jgi:hypothetical protein